MTAAECEARYYVLISDRQPYSRPSQPDVPAVFHHQDHAAEQGAALLRSNPYRTVIIEAYDEQFTFLTAHPHT